jgi:hypothetical protein
VVEALPLSRWLPKGEEELFARLRGATIVKLGGTDQCGIEGGGLILDYLIADEVRRIVFGFNENGMWVEYEGPSSASNLV